MSDPSDDVMRPRDGDETHAPKSVDAMATPPLSGSDENQNQVTEQQKQHWESSCRDHQLTTSNSSQSGGSPQSANMMTNTTGVSPHSDTHGPGPSSSSTCGPPGPSPALLTSLRSLGEHRDHTLLPQSLHQIAEAYFLDEDYRWAVHFLQLEQLYHQRLLSNLAALQEQWESQWKAGGTLPRADASPLADCPRDESERMDSLRHICRTHERPTLCMEKHMVDQSRTDCLGHCERYGGVQETVFCLENQHKRATPDESPHPTREQQEEGEEEEEEQEEDEDEELWEEQEDEEEEGVEELQMGAGEARSKGLRPMEDLAKCIQVEEMSPTNGLVSILKRRVSEEGEPSPPESSPRRTARRKVRFSEPSEDDSSADSCLILVVLCLVTVVISIGGTALYCLLGNASTDVCTDFSQNMDVYWGPVRSGIRWLTHWLFPVS
ncbi:consortin, connexin sorting protein b isoform X1 [Alosa pseudoharengus]|uniref:consortin, connexin sorting protein b isoform X1 n=2 Tax=Alosa pseudoharengus TaxID=34774 RepID=UPI003F891C61